MSSSIKLFAVALSLMGASLMVAGCTMQGSGGASSMSAAAPITGKVRGGQQPISGASVQLYAVNTTTSKGASTALLMTPATTDANGGFGITGGYTCPSTTALVYLVATGGNPGLGGTVNNTDIAQMAVLGQCGSLSASTFIQVNELTTVAAVVALAPFMADYAHVGNDSANASGLTGAFATAGSLVSYATGQIAAVATGATLPASLLDTMANIVAACVNTSGGVAGDGSACGTLLGKTTVGSTVPTNTVGALLGIMAAPAQNVSALFGLANAQSPFQPSLATAPGDFAVSTSYALPVQATYGTALAFRLLAIDTAQHVWVYTAVQTGTGTNDFTPGSLAVYDTNGLQLFTVAAGTGGLALPVQLAADPSGNMWALNNNATLSKFDGNGAALSPAGGYSVPFNVSASPAYSNTGWSHEVGLNYMSVDTSGNVWGIGSGTTSNCFLEVNSAGTLVTPAGNFCASAANSLTAAVTTDASGSAWFVGNNSVSKNTAGAQVTVGVKGAGCFAVDISNAVTVENSVQNLFWDRVNSRVWGVGNINAAALNTDGSQAFCDGGGVNLPVVPILGQTIPVFISAAALDGAGVLWYTTGPLSNVGGMSGLNATSPSGALLTPFNASAGVYGLLSASANFTNEKANLSEELAVDAYGNIWFISGNSALVKVPGLAVPKNHQ